MHIQLNKPEKLEEQIRAWSMTLMNGRSFMKYSSKQVKTYTPNIINITIETCCAQRFSVGESWMWYCFDLDCSATVATASIIKSKLKHTLIRSISLSYKNISVTRQQTNMMTLDAKVSSMFWAPEKSLIAATQSILAYSRRLSYCEILTKSYRR